MEHRANMRKVAFDALSTIETEYGNKKSMWYQIESKMLNLNN